MKFVKTKVDAEIYGESYSLRLPTVKEAQDYGKKAKKADDDKAADMILELLDNCGLPKDVSEQMEMNHLLQLVEVLIPAKKK